MMSNSSDGANVSVCHPFCTTVGMEPCQCTSGESSTLHSSAGAKSESAVKPVQKTTCIEGPPVYRDHSGKVQEPIYQYYCTST